MLRTNGVCCVHVVRRCSVFRTNGVCCVYCVGGGCSEPMVCAACGVYM